MCAESVWFCSWGMKPLEKTQSPLETNSDLNPTQFYIFRKFKQHSRGNSLYTSSAGYHWPHTELQRISVRTATGPTMRAQPPGHSQIGCLLVLRCGPEDRRGAGPPLKKKTTTNFFQLPSKQFTNNTGQVTTEDALGAGRGEQFAFPVSENFDTALDRNYVALFKGRVFPSVYKVQMQEPTFWYAKTANPKEEHAELKSRELNWSGGRIWTSIRFMTSSSFITLLLCTHPINFNKYKEEQISIPPSIAN